LENDIVKDVNKLQANLVKLVDAVKKAEDPAKLLEQIKKTSDELSKLVHEKADKSSPLNKKELESFLVEYENLLKDLPSTTKDAQKVPAKIPELEKLASEMSNALVQIKDLGSMPPDRDDEMLDSKAEGDLILASMKSRGAGKWNAKDLLTAAQELSDCLADLVDKSRNKQDLLENWDDILGLLDKEADAKGQKKNRSAEDILDKIFAAEARKQEEEKKKREDLERKQREE